MYPIELHRIREVAAWLTLIPIAAAIVMGVCYIIKGFNLAFRDAERRKNFGSK